VDVQRHEISVNGRDWHYLCDVIGTENIYSGNGRPKSVKEGFHLKLLDRKVFVMYPEEKLGGFINSASAQWQAIDALFQGVRDVMRSGTAFTSGTFSIAWTNACQKFWEVPFFAVSCFVNRSLIAFFLYRNLQHQISTDRRKPNGPANA